MYGFWGSILLIAMLNNAFTSFSHRRASRSVPDVEGSDGPSTLAKQNLLGRAIHWFKTNIIIPAVFGTKHRQLYYGFTITTRMETIIVGLFWSLTFVLSCVNIRTFEGNL
jgi:hypothetical protein